ncbi:MAG TPA: hypothetical protein VEC93_13235, partial [Anaerolineae bacterium]|nr:hypothetical protein [Anaerolineae bacterium]
MRFDKVYFFYPHLRLLAAIILACLAFYFQAALAVADDTTIERADVHAEAHVTTPPTSLSWAAAAIITPTQIADYLANPGIGWQEAQTPHNP